MGQYSVILVLSALVLGAVLLFNARASTGDASGETTAYTGDRLARETAQVGLERVELALTDSIDSWLSLEGDVFTGTYGDATYTVTITDVYVGPPRPRAFSLRHRIQPKSPRARASTYGTPPLTASRIPTTS